MHHDGQETPDRFPFEVKVMQQRISVTLSSSEVTALIADARANLRHPRDHMRFILRRELERRGLLPADVSAADDRPAQEVHHAQAG